MAGIRELIALFQDVALKSTQGVKSLAAELDKRPSSLYDELNPGESKTGQGKLGVEDALRLMELTGDFRPLEFMAARLGFIVSPLAEREPDGRDMTHECLQGFLAVSAFAEAAESGANYIELEPLLSAAVQELQDVFKRARARDCAKETKKLKKVG